MAIVALGANDARGVDPAERVAIWMRFTRLDARGIPTLLAGMMAPRNWGDDYVTRFDAIYPTSPNVTARCCIRFSSSVSRYGPS